MTERDEQAQLVGRFLESLSRIVDLGYGEDECDPVVTVMFEQLVRDSLPPEEIKKLPFRLPATRIENDTSHALLLKQATQLQRFVEKSGAGEIEEDRRGPVLFPFMTALGMAGGVFMVVVHLTRLMPAIL